MELKLRQLLTSHAWPFVRRSVYINMLDHYMTVCDRGLWQVYYWQHEAEVRRNEVHAARRGIARLKRRIRKLEQELECLKLF